MVNLCNYVITKLLKFIFNNVLDVKSKSYKIIQLKEGDKIGNEYNNYDWDGFRSRINKTI